MNFILTLGNVIVSITVPFCKSPRDYLNCKPGCASVASQMGIVSLANWEYAIPFLTTHMPNLSIFMSLYINTWHIYMYFNIRV